MTLVVIIAAISIGVSVSCQDSKTVGGDEYYTCPMHPRINLDQPGQCPICGMDLVLVKKESGNGHDDDGGFKGEKGVRINPTYVQNIGIKIEEVKVRELVRLVSTHGKVAHDAKLWVAEHEYIQALRLGDRSLIKSAELKLEYLGLSKEWIQVLKKKRKADITLHIESKEGPSFFEAYIYQQDISLISVGQKVNILDQKGRFLAKGTVKAVGTMVDLNTRSVRVLIESDKLLNLKLNTFVQFQMKFPLGKKLSVSKEAILFNGDHNMVYVVKEKGYYIPTRVELGEQAGGYYEVLGGLKAGDEVVTNGTFLIDSEAQIKMGGSGRGHEH